MRSAPGFAESLGASALKGREDAQRNNQNTAPEEAQKAAQQLVASAFLQPMFKQLRESQFKTGLFDGGQAEQAFQQRLHTRIADRMSQTMDLPMVDAVARYVSQRGGASGEASQTAAPERGSEVNRHG